PPRLAGVGAVRRGVSDRLRSGGAHDHRAARVAGGHHHGHHRGSGFLMASVPTLLRRFVFVIAIVSVAGTTADLESRITDISRSADLLPSLKLRRTAVALAEAGQVRPVASLPPSRPKGASASLAGAFGVGGKAR